MRAVIYARYSSDLQRDASIDDQIRLCEEHAGRRGWIVLERYSDRSTSGASLIRPGIQKLMRDASAGGFEVFLTEALDRLPRDQEHIAGLYKRLRFAGIAIVTLHEGEITELHVGLRGTMNALFLRDLADRTRRGLRGRVEAGLSGGGNSYGYEVVKRVALMDSRSAASVGSTRSRRRSFSASSRATPRVARRGRSPGS